MPQCKSGRVLIRNPLRRLGVSTVNVLAVRPVPCYEDGRFALASIISETLGISIVTTNPPVGSFANSNR